jgi:hypothetical protein
MTWIKRNDMAIITVEYKVNIIESERGWGSKVDDTKYFDEKKDAEDFVKEMNDKLDKDVVPDMYWYAEDPVEIPKRVF